MFEESKQCLQYSHSIWSTCKQHEHTTIELISTILQHLRYSLCFGKALFSLESALSFIFLAEREITQRLELGKQRAFLSQLQIIIWH
jgi:hypothetical protein